MTDTLYPDQIPVLLERVGEVLQDRGVEAGIVVVGGAALNLRGVIRRTTVDVDVIALQQSGGRRPASDVDRAPRTAPRPGGCGRPGSARLRPPITLDEYRSRHQWRTGLLPGLAERVEWRRYGGLSVGLAGREDLIALKLHAAADQDPQSQHVQDLLALHPTREELDAAASWVRKQDAGAGFSKLVDEVIDYVAARTQ